MAEVHYKQIAAIFEDRGVAPSEDVLLVRIGEQKLYHFRNGREWRSYSVSTGARLPSCVEDSGGTPLGLHRVRDRIGGGEPLGMIFEGRRPTGRCYLELLPEANACNRITTRILRLEGMEEGENRGPGRDSFERYIYIHGTNREQHIGTPASGGCILLRNQEMLELFDSVAPETLVWIEL